MDLMPEEIRKRLDVAASERLPMLSRAFVRKLIDNERITVNGEQSKAGHRLRLGDTLEIMFDPMELEKIDSIDLPILYEDNDVMVIDKPTGVISHARGKHWNEPSVASFVREKTAQSGERAGIVHRLDRATSGVMICAKNQAALIWLQKQFADRLVEKSYVAIVTGEMSPAAAIIDMPIERNPKTPQTFRVGANGKSAVTGYEVLEKTDLHTKLLLKPKTGRTHQLRVHLEEVGHPIVGDILYEGEAADRLYLHAYQLRLTLPDGSLHSFEAPVPDEFSKIMDKAA